MRFGYDSYGFEMRKSCSILLYTVYLSSGYEQHLVCEVFIFLAYGNSGCTV